jgi:hypothetical protein
MCFAMCLNEHIRTPVFSRIARITQRNNFEVRLGFGRDLLAAESQKWNNRLHRKTKTEKFLKNMKLMP